MIDKNRLYRKWLTPVLHGIAWLVFFIYPFLIHDKPLFKTDILFRLVLSTLMLMAFFYTNAYLLIPRLFARKRFLVYFLSVAVIVALLIWGHFLLQWLLNWEFYNDHAWMQRKVLTSSLFTTLLVWAVSSGITLAQEWLRSENLKREMKSEKLASELAMLKSQVNPHFLFNALNSIYALANRQSERTKEAVVKLSELLRYTLYEAADESVTLAREIDFLENYIALQELRLPEQVEVNFDVDGAPKDRKIAPLLLLPFVENAFKHGVSYEAPSSIAIRLKVEPGQLDFYVENAKHQHAEEAPEKGIGLKNVNRRLELLYPQRHELSIQEEEERFKVHLKIRFDD